MSADILWPEFIPGRSEDEIVDEVSKAIANFVKELKPGESLLLLRHGNEPGKNLFTVTLRQFS